MDRNKHNNVSEQGEVNEFLGQLNNCGDDGVMVIAATNKPSLIDPAALRAGRLELKYYIPEPDAQTRKEIFRIGLKGRNAELGIDYDKLALLTQGRVSSDIRLIEEAIALVEPTVSEDEIKQCERVRDEFRKSKTVRPRIGFK